LYFHVKAQKAGVQPEDRLVSIQDNDKQLPVQNPGEEIVISQKNYHEALTLVRTMHHVRFSFLSNGMQAFL